MADQTPSKAKSSKELQREREAAIDASFQNPNTSIVSRFLEDEMRKSFIDYAMSVITDRALPDVRDGLKPVHRRILYSKYTQGLTPDKPYRKCATTIGDVLGRFHPHGDAAVYDALVRMAQDFSMRHVMVDGHGNFGSRDGDPPAAYRYTESRLTRLSVEMMNNINKNTVDFVPNYDEHELEPTVLPAGFPNLLVNGSTGIAVGMATNIPPHNLGEAIDATIYLIDNPGSSADDLMQIIPGPDFPTYGTIIGTSGIRQAYRTGKGKIVVRSKIDVEEMRGNRFRLVVRDLPYQVNKARLIERIAELSKDKRIEGISDLRDESDRNEEVRIVIELKREATPMVVINQLYRHTQLQDNFNANMIALVADPEGRYEPKIVNLPQMLQYFIDHQRDVTTRRLQFDLAKAEARKHIVEGLQLAIDHIDEVINIIRASKNESEAKVRLQERFGLSEKQAQHVVDMRLGRLSGLERDKLQAEFDGLVKTIAELNAILASAEKLDQVIKDELLVIKKKYADERRTTIDPTIGDDIDDESLIEEESIVVAKSHFGYIKRMPVEVYSQQHRGGRGITAMQTKEEDFVDTIITTSTHDHLLFFTNLGRVYRLKGYQVPEASRQAKGMALVNLLQLTPEERVMNVIAISEEALSEDCYLLIATKAGLLKKTAISEFASINRNGKIAITLRENDQLVGVNLIGQAEDIVLVSRLGMAIHFASNQVRASGRTSMGVRGMNLQAGDELVSLVVAKAEDTILCVTEYGYGKRSELADYRLTGRGGKGIKTYKPSGRTGLLVGAVVISDENDVLLINDAGVIIRIAAGEIPVLSRNTQGVTLMRSRDSKVIDMAVVEAEIEESETQES